MLSPIQMQGAMKDPRLLEAAMMDKIMQTARMVPGGLPGAGPQAGNQTNTLFPNIAPGGLTGAGPVAQQANGLNPQALAPAEATNAATDKATDQNKELQGKVDEAAKKAFGEVATQKDDKKATNTAEQKTEEKDTKEKDTKDVPQVTLAPANAPVNAPANNVAQQVNAADTQAKTADTTPAEEIEEKGVVKEGDDKLVVGQKYAQDTGVDEMAKQLEKVFKGEEETKTEDKDKEKAEAKDKGKAEDADKKAEAKKGEKLDVKT